MADHARPISADVDLGGQRVAQLACGLGDVGSYSVTWYGLGTGTKPLAGRLCPVRLEAAVGARRAKLTSLR